jgi:hypothetical protein
LPRGAAIVRPPERQHPLVAPAAAVLASPTQTFRFTDIAALTPEKLMEQIADTRQKCGWAATTGNARKWWEIFERENVERPERVLRVLEELLMRSATIADFFNAFLASNTENIQANLHYLDYRRFKKEADHKK